MSLADCPKCWSALCECGYQYRNWSVENLDRLIATLQEVRDKVNSHAKAYEEALPNVVVPFCLIVKTRTVTLDEASQIYPPERAE